MLPILPIIQKEAWVQCENPNCGKWRKLPLGTQVDENEAWYCYMNPDCARNTCSASEVEYDESNEFVIADTEETEEAARNKEIIEKLEASIAAQAAAALNAPRGKGRARSAGSKRGRGGRGRGRPSGVAARPGSFPSAYDAPFRQSLYDEDVEELDDSEGGILQQLAARQSRKQAAKTVQRVLENFGSWDPIAARGSGAVPTSLPPEAWDTLGQNGGSEAAEIASLAADLASSAKYFEDTGAGGDAAEESGTLATLAAALAAACGVIATEDAFNSVERESLGLDGAAPLPDPLAPLDVDDVMPGQEEVPLDEAAPAQDSPSPLQLQQQQQQQNQQFLQQQQIAQFMHHQQQVQLHQFVQQQQQQQAGVMMPPVQFQLNPAMLAAMQQQLLMQQAQGRQQQQQPDDQA